jgi:phosphatidylinositol alpha-mannosyltransferase
MVCPYSWSFPGGVQAHVGGLARAVREQGVEVDILAPVDGPAEGERPIALGRTVAIRDNGSVTRVALGPAAVARTRRAIAAGGYDLLHLHEPILPATCLTALLTAHLPLVGTFHMSAERPGWYGRFAPFCRWALRRLDVRVAVSASARDHVARTCPADYRIIPNGIDLAEERVEGGVRDGSRVVFVGRPDRRKGLPVLLEAFARLRGRPSLELVGVTQRQLGQIAPGLSRGVAARVRPHGRVDDAARRRLLAEADVLVAPSLRGESFGVVLLEGMAAGLPVVASALPGYAQILAPGCGRLVPPGRAEPLAAALTELLADPETRRRMGAAGRRAVERFGWDRIAEELVGVYMEALGGLPARPAPALPPEPVARAAGAASGTRR